MAFLFVFLTGLVVGFNACEKDPLQASSAGNPSSQGPRPRPGQTPVLPNGVQPLTPTQSGPFSVEDFGLTPSAAELVQAAAAPSINIRGKLRVDISAGRGVSAELLPIYESLSSSTHKGKVTGTTQSDGSFSMSLSPSGGLVSGLKYRLVIRVTDISPSRVLHVEHFQIGNGTQPLDGGTIESRCAPMRPQFSSYTTPTWSLPDMTLAWNQRTDKNELSQLLAQVYWGTESSLTPIRNLEFASREAGAALSGRWSQCSTTEFITENLEYLFCRETPTGPLRNGSQCPGVLGLSCGPMTFVAGEIAESFSRFAEAQVEWNYRRTFASVQGALYPFDEMAYCMWRDGHSVLGLKVSGL